MFVVFVAGGLGDLGRLIVEELVDIDKHEIYVLSRKAGLDNGNNERANFSSTVFGLLTETCFYGDQVPHDIGEYKTASGKKFPQVLQTDYTEASLTRILKNLQAHTVISALNLDWAEASASQVNLIKAAVASGTVKRFVPSEFNIDYDLDDDILPYAEKKYHCAARRELEKTNLEYVYIYCGMFMDYFGLPYFPTAMRALYSVIDLPNHQAVIPGDGDSTIAATYTKDVARLVAKSLDLPKWPRVFSIAGSEISCNELIKLIERVTGERLEVRSDSVQFLRSRRCTLLPSNSAAADQFPRGLEQLTGLLADLSLPMALGAYDVHKAKGSVDLVNTLKGEAGPLLTIDKFFEITWKEKLRRDQGIDSAR